MIELKIRVPGGALSKTSVSYGTWQKYEIIKRNHILFRSIPTDCKIYAKRSVWKRNDGENAPPVRNSTKHENYIFERMQTTFATLNTC